MFKILLTSLTFLSSYTPLIVQAVEENQYQIMYDIYHQGEIFKFYKFKGRRDVEVSYFKLGKKMGSRGSILISVGRSEPSLNYLETAYDLYNGGFSPIYVTAHRGQGYSDRRLKDHFRGYVRHFGYYANDLNSLTNIIRKEIKNSSLYLIGHSMGGAIALDYLQKYKSQFKKVALVTPMLQIKLDNGESSALRDTALACYLPFAPFCTDYVPNGGPPVLNPDFYTNRSTSSFNRFNFITYLTRLDPKMDLGSATIRWVRESILANRRMRSQKYIDKIKTPILLFQAGKDKIVENLGQDEFCKKAKLCKKIRYDDSLHTPIIERDEIRNDTISRIINFLK
jgi:lysophospholipase